MDSTRSPTFALRDTDLFDILAGVAQAAARHARADTNVSLDVMGEVLERMALIGRQPGRTMPPALRAQAMNVLGSHGLDTDGLDATACARVVYLDLVTILREIPALNLDPVPDTPAAVLQKELTRTLQELCHVKSERDALREMVDILAGAGESSGAENAASGVPS